MRYFKDLVICPGFLTAQLAINTQLVSLSLCMLWLKYKWEIQYTFFGVIVWQEKEISAWKDHWVVNEACDNPRAVFGTDQIALQVT